MAGLRRPLVPVGRGVVVHGPARGVPLLLGGGEQVSPAIERRVEAPRRRGHDAIRVHVPARVPRCKLGCEFVLDQVEDAPNPFAGVFRGAPVLQRSLEVRLDGAAGITEDEQLRDAGVERLVDAGEPHRLEMAVDQVPVRELQYRRTDFAVDHGPGIAEEVLVVGALRRRVGDDQGGLTAAARAPAALGVVRRRGRHVAHVDRVQSRDVDAELHRRGAEEHRQEPVGLAGLPEPLLVRRKLFALAITEAEALLPDLAVVGIDLGGVLARLEPEERVHGGAEHPREILVEVAEERVLPGTAAVLRRAAQLEEDARVVESPSGLIERSALLRNEAVCRARTEQVLDEPVELLRLQLADGRVAAPEAHRAQRSPETASRAAAHDQLHVAERARPAGGRDDHQPARDSGLLVRTEPPGRPEPAVRLRDHLLQDGGVENLAADRHPLPHVIEQLAVDRGPDGVVGVLQQGVRVGERDRRA